MLQRGIDVNIVFPETIRYLLQNLETTYNIENVCDKNDVVRLLKLPSDH